MLRMMLRMMPRIEVSTLVLVVGLLALGTGCIEKTLVNGQIAGTRKASVAFDTIGDLELAEKAASAGIVQFEGMHVLAPDNDDGLFLLTKSWGGYGFGFAEDAYATATLAGNKDVAKYHQYRAKAAYDRAVFYGLEWMKKRADGFEPAKKNEVSLKKWLVDNMTDKADGEMLFWLGYAWMSRASIMRDDDEFGPPLVAELYVGVEMMERSVALDPDYNHSSGMIVLAAYHARMPGPELVQSKQLFDTVLQKTGRKTLMAQLQYALTYACTKSDRALYEKLINEVLTAPDADPNQRLTNAIARRRAKRALAPKNMGTCGMYETAEKN